MAKRTADDDNVGGFASRRNPFAPIDGIPLSADCWYMIYDMLHKHDHRVKLKLLNKSACALFTRRCTCINAHGVRVAQYLPVEAYTSRAMPIPYWLLTPNLRRLNIDCTTASRLIEPWLVRHALTSVKARTSRPIELALSGTQFYRYRDTLCIPGKLSESFHTILFRSVVGMYYVIYKKPSLDLSGVTLTVINATGCPSVDTLINDDRAPLAVRYVGPLAQVSEAMRTLGQLFTPELLFVGDSPTPYQFPALENRADCK